MKQYLSSILGKSGNRGKIGVGLLAGAAAEVNSVAAGIREKIGAVARVGQRAGAGAYTACQTWAKASFC